MCAFACLTLNSSYIWPLSPSFRWDAFSAPSRVFLFTESATESNEGRPQAELQYLTHASAIRSDLSSF